MGVIIFVLVWVVLGLGIFFIAIRGGPRGARESLYGQSRRSRRVTGVVMLVLYLGIGVAVPAIVIAAGREKEDDLKGGKSLTSAEANGRVLFSRFCVQCHTLAAANSVGKVGPNLDQLRPPRALVLDAVTHGRARGNGRMPAGLVVGNDAKDVAAFVAKVAGQQ
jgi:mono/diheme cytochrome c family protein